MPAISTPSTMTLKWGSQLNVFFSMRATSKPFPSVIVKDLGMRMKLPST